MALFFALSCLATARAEELPQIEQGYPAFKIYSTSEIGAPRGSRLVAEDAKGRILFSSNGELSAFDGTNWKRVSSPGERAHEDYYAIKHGPDGEIYVGGIAFWGKLAVDDRGRYIPYSFATAAEQTEASIENFNQIAICGENVYYAGLNRLVRWNADTGSRVWEVPAIEEIFEFRGSLYLQQLNVGLHRVAGDELVLVEGSEILTRDRSRTVRSSEWFDGRMALFNNKRGIVLFDGAVFEDIPDEIEHSEQRTWANDMLRLDDQTFALSLMDQGLVFLDVHGRIITRVDQTLDHQLLECGDIEQAADGSLWVTVSDGVAQVLYPSPITFFDRSLDFPLIYPTVQRFDDALYLRNSAKLYRSEYDAFGRLRGFTRFDRLRDQEIQAIESTPDGLLIGTDLGLYRLDRKREIHVIIEGFPVYLIHANEHTADTITLTNADNAYILKRDGERYILLQTLPIGGRANKLLDDATGDIWLERGISRVGRISRSDGSYAYKEYGVADGLTSEQWVPVWTFERQARFSSRKGVLRFDREDERFVVADDINNLIPHRSKALSRPATDPDGNLWISSRSGNLVLRKQDDGSYVEDTAILRFLGNFPIDEFIFDQSGVVWLSSRKALARVDPSKSPATPAFPSPRLVQVVDERTGDLIHHYKTLQAGLAEPLDYSRNSLTFGLSTPYFQPTRGIRHRYLLSGYTETWSEPQSLSEITFLRLPPGRYDLLVQASTESGDVSPIASFPFAVAPPFYRTIPAYLGYAAAAFGLLYLLLKSRHRTLLARQKNLKAKIAEQTRELREKNIQLHGAFLSERELKKRAEQANEAKSEFLAMVSHEIRTPMNCMIGMVENLLDTPMGDEQFQMLKTMRSSGQSLVTIISDILDYSKIEAGKIKLDERPLSPAECVLETLKLFESVCAEKGLKLMSEIADDVPELVMGDPIRLKQIIINLTSNAHKFTESGFIKITLKHAARGADRSTLYFTVEDSGIGIESSKMDLLFKSFSQIDSSNTRRYGGTGLGLAICKRLVTLMGGNIGVSSQTGHGSTFSFWLTTRLPTLEEAQAFKRIGRSAASRKTRPIEPLPRSLGHSAPAVEEAKEVLLVDDNPINQQVTAMMLRRLGFSYDVVDNGTLACEVVARKDYEVVLMDIQMPGMDGIECTRLILQDQRDRAPAIVAVTAKSSDLDREMATAAGMTGFLTKPFERAQLKEAITAALEKKPVA